MRRARHLLRISGEFLRYATVHREWWIVAVVALVAVAVAFTTAGHAAAPYTLYTLF